MLAIEPGSDIIKKFFALEKEQASEFEAFVSSFKSEDDPDGGEWTDLLAYLYWDREWDDESLMRFFRCDWAFIQSSVRILTQVIECGRCENPIHAQFNNHAHKHNLTVRCMVLCPECASLQRAENITARVQGITSENDERRRRYAAEARLQELRTMPYQDYLCTPEWYAKRQLVLERDNHACRLCSSMEHLNVHHRTYENRGDEPLEDLTTLCQPCHQLFHANTSLCLTNGQAGH